MPNQLEIKLTLQRDLPPFQSALARGLRLDATDQHEIATVDWMLWTPWIVTTFSDDERMSGVDMEDSLVRSLSERGRQLLGNEVMFNDTPHLNLEGGELSKRAQTLGARKDLGSQGRYEALTEACARFLMTSCALIGAESRFWIDQVPSIPQTRIDVDRDTHERLRIRFPRNKSFTYPLYTNPESVVTFGPGMSGSIFVADMVGRAKNVHLVSGGISALFLRSWNQDQLRHMTKGIENLRKTGELATKIPGLSSDQIRLPETFFYDDGIAASIGMIASRTVERGKPVDIIVMSSVHGAGRQEIESGVDGAHQLLREGGLLVVKAPRTSLGNEGGLDVVASRAMPQFGGPVAAGEAGRLSQYIDPSLPLERPADFAIFQKQ